MNTQQLVQETCKKYPEALNRTLARLLHEQYPETFLTVEKARNHVRRVRGVSGEQNRKQTSDKSGFKEPGVAGTIAIPKGIRQMRAPKRFNDLGKWLICGDLHVPYHDEKAIVAMLEFAVKQGVQHVYINGDLMDFYQLSRFCRDPRFPKAKKEIKIAKVIAAEIARLIPGRKVFKIGNHDWRFQNYLAQGAAELVGIEDFELFRVLGMEAMGYELVESFQMGYIGKLPIFHGHELPGGGAVNPARGVYLRVAESAVVNHHHRTSEHNEPGAIKKNLVTCWSIGCLCDMKPEYAIINKWNQGCAVIENFGDNYHFENFKIVNGNVY